MFSKSFSNTNEPINVVRADLGPWDQCHNQLNLQGGNFQRFLPLFSRGCEDLYMGLVVQERNTERAGHTAGTKEATVGASSGGALTHQGLLSSL